MAEPKTMKPGLLVSLKTELKGGVSYVRETIETAHRTETGTQLESWKTLKRVDDADEHERATKVRNAASALVRACCYATCFGLFCLQENIENFRLAEEQAYKLARDFNAEAKNCRVGVYVFTGRVAANEEEAARKITAEMADILGDMERGVASLNVEAIREAADRAKEMGAMLDDDSSAKIQVAVEAGRRAARQIKKLAEKGEAAAAELTAITRVSSQAISMARFSFLDSAPAGDVEMLPTVNVSRFAELESGGDAPGIGEVTLGPNVVRASAEADENEGENAEQVS